MRITLERITIIIMIMTTMLRGENYAGNDNYYNNDNDDDTDG